MHLRALMLALILVWGCGKEPPQCPEDLDYDFDAACPTDGQRCSYFLGASPVRPCVVGRMVCTCKGEEWDCFIGDGTICSDSGWSTTWTPFGDTDTDSDADTDSDSGTDTNAGTAHTASHTGETETADTGP